MSIENLSPMLIDMANIAVTNKHKIVYGLSVGIFIFDLGLFQMSRSTSCNSSTVNISQTVMDRANIAIANNKLKNIRHETENRGIRTL